MMESERLSDSGSGDEVTPADAAAAAELVAKFAVPLQAARELQVKEKKKSPTMSQEEILAWLNEGGGELQNQERNFAMLLVEEITESDPRWQSPGVVSLLVNKNTQHLKLKLTPVCECTTRWTVEDLELLCTDIGTQCKDSLRSLVIANPTVPRHGFPGLSMAQLSALLQQLHGLTELSLGGKFEPHEIDSLITALASSNPDIKHLSVPCLSTEGLNEIADRWPGLEVLQVQYEALFEHSDLSAVLPRLPSLRELGIKDREKQTLAMLDVAFERRDLGCPPYVLTGSVDCSVLRSRGKGLESSFFSTFPAVEELHVTVYTDIPALCAGLEAHPVLTSINSLDVNGVRLANLEPLLAIVGKNLKKFEVVFEGAESDIDLVTIGELCPKLEDLHVLDGTLVANKQHQASPSYFSSLKRCVLLRDESDLCEVLPNSLIHCLLASPHLEKFEADDLPIPKAVAASVIAECGENGALSCLTDLTLSVRYMSTEVVAELISHAPRLLELHIQHADVEVKNVLSSFLEQSRLQCEPHFSMKCELSSEDEDD